MEVEKKSYSKEKIVKKHKKKTKKLIDRNLIYEKRYKLVRHLSTGSFGQCFDAIDLQNGNKSVVVKVNEEREMNQIEGEVLLLLNRKGFMNFP
jgi:hypothetical protein